MHVYPNNLTCFYNEVKMLYYTSLLIVRLYNKGLQIIVSPELCVTRLHLFIGQGALGRL
jgi:hypothetical protein